MFDKRLIFVLFVLSFFLVSSSNANAEIEVTLNEFYEENESWFLDTTAMTYEVYSDYFNEVNIDDSAHKILMDYDRDTISHRYEVYYGEVVDNRRFLVAFNKAFPLNYIKDHVNIYAGINQQNYYDLSGQPGFEEWLQKML